MEVKKNDKVKIENFSKLFFQLGLVLSLFIVYIALEHKVFERNIDELVGIINQEEVEEDIPITERIEIIKPPPPPAVVPETIAIVEDQTEIEETVLESTETDQSDAVEAIEISEIEEAIEEEEVAEDVPFAVIEEAPIYPGCKGSKAERKKCLVEKITKHVAKNYNTELSQELGLQPGRKKVYVLFKINSKGDVSDIQVRGPHKRLEQEAVRIVKLLPKMAPAKQRGRAVGVKYTLPITLEVRQ